MGVPNSSRKPPTPQYPPLEVPDLSPEANALIYGIGTIEGDMISIDSRCNFYTMPLLTSLRRIYIIQHSESGVKTERYPKCVLKTLFRLS